MMLANVDVLDVLIVDDSAEDACAISRQLRSVPKAAYAIREERSPRAALDVCLRSAPDCLLLDLRMAELNGLEFLRHLREAGVEMPVVVLTGFQEDGHAIQALRLGAQDFLIKGETTPELLRRSIDHARERFRIGQELARSQEGLRKANAELREHVERLQAIFCQTGVGIAQTTLDGHFTLVNDTFCNLAAREREELLGMRLTDLAEDAAEREAQSEEEHDTQYHRPGREPIWVRENTSLVHDVEGNPTGKVILARNITGRKSAEAAQLLLASIVEGSADAMIFHDSEGIIRAWNQGAEKTYGYSALEMLGKPYSLLVPADRFDDWCRTCIGAAGGNPVQGQESIRICKTGYRVPVAATLSAVRNQAGEVVGFSSIERDISSRKRGEEGLRQSEARYRMLANAMPQIVYTANAEGETEFVNRRWSQYTGCPEEQGLTFHWLQRLHEEDRSPALEKWRASIGTGHPFQTEYRLLRADGEYRWHLSRALPLKNDEGKVHGWIGTSTDIHDRKLTETTLKISMECLRLAQSAAGVVVWDLDLQQNRYAELHEFFEQFEFEPETVVSFQDWLQRIHPDDRDRIIEVTRNPKQFAEGFELEFRVVRKDGSVRWLLGKGSAISDCAGRPVRVTGANVDITERKRAEEELRASRERLHFALMAAGMGIWEWDVTDDRIEWSEEMGPLLGLPSGRAEVKLEDFLQRVHYVDRARVESEIQASLGGDVPYAVEFRVVWPDGSMHWMEAQGAVQRRTSGEVARMIGTARDVTARRTLEQKLSQAMKLESIGALAAGVAHDFNNLLVGVVGSASLAQDLLPPGHEAVKLLEDVVDAGQRAATLTAQMLAYSGKAHYHAQHVDVCRAADEAAQTIRPLLQTGTDLVLDCRSAVKAIGAAEQIRQSIVSVLKNAVESIEGPAGKITLRVQAEEITGRYISEVLKNSDISSGTFVKIEVEDNGAGIDESIKDKIFDPFFSTKFMGRGLGLSAVAGIVRMHHGAISVTSSPGVGTRVEILLPAVAQAQAPSVPSFSGGERAVTGSVLVVDDEAMVAALVKKVLEARAHKVLVANSGESALELIRSGREAISLVLLDLTMPGMDGVETLRWIRQIDRELPVILSSGYSVAHALSEVDEGSISGFLQKPYSAQQLLRMISDFLSHRQGHTCATARG